jgi:hypothetical protein
LTDVEAVALGGSISVAVTVQDPVDPGAVYTPDVLPIDPHDADHVTSSVAENCRASFTMTTGLIGTIWNAAGPAPERVTFCGLPLPESAKLSVAVRVPDTDGLNTTLTVQLAAAARLEPQVLLEMAKSPGFEPPIVIPLMVMEDVVPLLNVAVWDALVDPTAVFGKPMLVGETVTLPDEAVPPVPVKLTFCGLLLAESATFNVAARDPVVAGLNISEMVQLADAARLLPQVLLEIVKSPGFVPVNVMPLIVMEEPVPLVNVADFDELVEPTLIVPNEREVGLILTLPLVPNPVSATF